MKLQISAKPYAKLTSDEKKRIEEQYDNCCSVKESAEIWIEKFEKALKNSDVR